MASQKEHKDKLVARFASNKASEEELQAFFGLLNTDELDISLESDMDREILALRNGVLLRNKPFLWVKIMGIAAAVAVVVIGLWFFTAKDQVRGKIAATDTNDIAPGKNRAVLSLGNGEIITLSEEKSGLIIDVSSGLTYNDGTKVNTSSQGLANSGERKMLTMSTPKGGTYQVILPDGTKTWLNSASTLKFPENFSGVNQRRVELIGEAYFEVAKDKGHPFVVSSGEQEVEVLGTHFNINSYQSEGEMRTTLLEGSVKVHYKSNDYLLKPGMQAEIGNRVRVLNVDADQMVAWMKGDFNFKDENIRSIMRKLERWYDIEVVYEGNISDVDYGAEISRNKTLKQVLHVLGETGVVHFKIEGRRVTVMQ